ncbi:hypothetical protein FGE12_25445 [Aggregicoccus sp. 17bor-14]|uniref:hypothetical protein n=1 Tax=Myxococcaceae TaxID=31 RepID=UPI00129CC03D|nr:MULTISPECIES: hypothetical protein [Myxococcaceae]MBF5045778.1 hypothetical protein [Simulacricoccus sp. 17bor-14]MRI91513.1 hypothetical protein [Aggregicoccus sp. 17bor-14]
MLRKLLGAGAVLTVLLAGCREPLSACSSQEDCDQGQTCDPKAKLCVVVETPDGLACETACGQFEACKDAACTARFSGYSFVLPRENGGVKSGDVTLKVQLVKRTDIVAEPHYPDSINFTITPKSGAAASSGTLAHQGQGLYAGVWKAPDGTSSDKFDLEVRSEALAVPGKTTFSLDNTPPSFTVAVTTPLPGPNVGQTIYVDPAPQGPYYRRDQVVTVTIASDEAIDESTVRLTVTGIGSGTQIDPLTVTNAGSACGKAYCGEVQVDLSKPPMNDFRGSFGLVASGNDAAGNPGTKPGSIKVTRWKWRRATTSVGSVEASPAVGATGLIYVGSNLAGSDGQFVAVRPDGTEAWSARGGSIRASPAVGETASSSERVYVAQKVGTKSAAGYFNSTSNSFVEVCQHSEAGVSVEASLAFTKAVPGTTSETVYGSYRGWNGGTLFAIRPEAANTCPTKGGVGDVIYPSNMVVFGDSVAFAEAAGTLKTRSLDAVGDWGSTGLLKAVPLKATSLALAGTQFWGGSNDGSASKVYTVGTSEAATPVLTAASDAAWNVSVGTSGTAIIGLAEKKLLRLSAAGVAEQPVVVDPDVFKGAPVWGEDGVVHVASSTTGEVQARFGSSIVWHLTAPDGDVFEASMNLDCSRNAAGEVVKGAPGVLYAASASGNLYALITDSRGLDPNSPWPKYQHDSRNTGNPATPVTNCK